MLPCPIVQARIHSGKLYPLRFSPVLRDYTWGGRGFETRLGRLLPPGVTAESWEISGHPDGLTRVFSGPLAGTTLPQLQRRFGPALVGRQSATALAADRFPLLIKLLDAADWLSVQVHPDDSWAIAHEGDSGKTEMWIVLHAEPGAQLIQGFRRGVDRDLFAAAVREGRGEEGLHRVAVETGDVFFLRPGTIHAIGPGLLLAEIQQSSNVTYRVYDWNRGDPDRPLHLAAALEVLDFEITEPGPVIPELVAEQGLSLERLAVCPHFETCRLHLTDSRRWSGSCDGATFEIWAALAGSATLRWSRGSETLTAVEWILLPADLGDFEIVAEESATLVRVRTP